MLRVPVRFGLDFGTSNTSLAVWAGERSDVLPLDPIAGAAMPTVLYVRRDGSSSVGRPAIETYLEDNRTRGPIKREYLPLGFKMVSSNPFQKPVDAVILTDVNSPGRLFQALKTFLGDELDVRTNVFGAERGLEELIAIVLAHVRDRVNALVGTAPEEITIGRPVEYIGGAAAGFARRMGSQAPAPSSVHRERAPRLARALGAQREAAARGARRTGEAGRAASRARGAARRDLAAARLRDLPGGGYDEDRSLERSRRDPPVPPRRDRRGRAPDSRAVRDAPRASAARHRDAPRRRAREGRRRRRGCRRGRDHRRVERHPGVPCAAREEVP